MKKELKVFIYIRNYKKSLRKKIEKKIKKKLKRERGWTGIRTRNFEHETPR